MNTSPSALVRCADADAAIAHVADALVEHMGAAVRDDGVANVAVPASISGRPVVEALAARTTEWNRVFVTGTHTRWSAGDAAGLDDDDLARAFAPTGARVVPIGRTADTPHDAALAWAPPAFSAPFDAAVVVVRDDGGLAGWNGRDRTLDTARMAGPSHGVWAIERDFGWVLTLTPDRLRRTRWLVVMALDPKATAALTRAVDHPGDESTLGWLLRAPRPPLLAVGVEA